ncbi:hypothetical protein J3F84DRAFT_401169 [Trichoderma pleuroticola]
MRLINTKTFKLEEFSDGSIPSYAILSHTWGKDSEELSFRDVERGIIDLPAAASNGQVDKPAIGSIKFRGCCQKAVEDGLGYAWIDTCCIDKTNLVELSEAINSMFRWYSRASVCYAYLSDVPDDDDPPKPGSKFQSSRWFQRGWTLQELLAPKNLRFYNSEWRCIGTKGTIGNLIKSITRVPRPFLLGITSLHTASVAQRMSWAAQRQTKRPEDLAYCLLGIFGIAMPMIYGEGGDQAFFRLQEQIMRTTRDDSILAWDLDDTFHGSRVGTGDEEIFAPDPSHFANSGDIVIREHTNGPLHSLDMSGGSLRIYLSLLTTVSGPTFGLLNCGPASSSHKVVAIPLAKAASGASDEYVRLKGHPSALRTVAAPGTQPELIYIKKNGQRNASSKADRQFWLYEDDLFARFNLTLVDVEPSSCWDKQTNLVSPINSDDASMSKILLRFRHDEAGSQDFVTMLEAKHLDPSTDPWADTMVCKRGESLLQIAQDFRWSLSKVSVGKMATNGMLYLRIKLEPVEDGIVSIHPEAIHLQPDATINASNKAALILDFKQLMMERRRICNSKEKVKANLIIHEWQMQEATQCRESLELEIQELEERKRGWVEQEKENAQEIYHLRKEQAKVDETEDLLSKQLLQARAQLDELELPDSHQVSSTLFQEALYSGDADVVKLLYHKLDDMAALNDGWIPLIAATTRGDFDAVHEILKTPGVQPDATDTLYGRTALSWASEHGHERIAHLLLDTKKLDINSRDYNGRTPLQWASEKKQDKMAQLLLGREAEVDGPLREHRAPIRAMAFSHDSKLIATVSPDDTLKIWDSATGKCQQTLQGYGEKDARKVIFSHDAKLVVSASDNGSIRVWNRMTGRCQSVLRGHTGIVHGIALFHDSRLLVSGSADATIKVWDTTTGSCYAMMQGDGTDIRDVAVSHDSSLMAYGFSSRIVQTWVTETQKVRRTFQGHKSPVSSVAFSCYSDRLLSCDDAGVVMIWDMTGQCLQTICSRHPVSVVTFSPNSKLVVTGSASKHSVHVWNSTTGKLLRQIEVSDGVADVIIFSRDLRLIASAPKSELKCRRVGDRGIEVVKTAMISSAT